MALIRFRGPKVTPQQQAQQYPASFIVLARIHDEAAAARQQAKDAITKSDVDALATAIRQLAAAEAQARTLTDLLEAIHWEALTRAEAQAEASDALAAPDLTDDEMDAMAEAYENGYAARRGPYA